MKKTITVLLSAAMLLISLSGCSQPADNSGEITELKQEIAELRSQVEALQQKISDLEAGPLSGYTLTGTPLTQGSGAAIALTATPTRYQEGQLAQFRVLLDGSTAAELYCQWDGSCYTANVELDAADGYSYCLILTEPGGTQKSIDLNSPANPLDPTLVNMYSSLSASCFLNLYEAQAEGSTLTIHSATAEVYLPSLTANGEPAACTGASLVLQLDGSEVQRMALSVPHEAPAAQPLLLDASANTFSVPELEEGSQLDLWLEVVLSDGQVLTHFASSWHYAEGELIQAVG